MRQNESTRGTGNYIIPDKWEKMSAEEHAIIAERGKFKTGTKIGQVRIESPQSNERRELIETKEVKIKRKKSEEKRGGTACVGLRGPPETRSSEDRRG